jgi:hypothetical protein
MRDYQANPMDFIAAMKSGQNPEQLLFTFLQQNGIMNNPMMSNLFTLAKSGKTAELEQIARNIARERGIDYDKEFSAFKKTWGIK